MSVLYHSEDVKCKLARYNVLLHLLWCVIQSNNKIIIIIIIRGHIRACVLAIDLGVVTRRGFCTLCLINIETLSI